ncbi:dipeptidase PepV [Alicyclobacillus cycloheptanicus]|uniref:Succinyl-diaminopimelate desuccinylase n=1 Tax=Alicyclobacillus cycloheptanicus TaxID=1457 RepID=A0ABT9XDV4_9BACL|nr:dipeptidase PepV [Alicyclobacillus cycloheptanicus]MDQ0188472.1 succinyl-diaminopimelate desuccinylase [Alicyclobacillus cycloheptanicus]WDM01163.1 dipeptidase PepV [Alicyclobacillus cycloheptanicus]
MFKEFIETAKQDMVQSLQELLQIPSVEEAPLPDQPFGAGPARALAYMLNLAQQEGFAVKNVDGYAGHVEYGEGDEYVAVVSHLDVVPAGSNWTYPPFGAEIHDGLIYARGAIDDKGPAMSTLWALIALKRLGMKPRRKIRLIFGLDEESGWECMAHYFAKEPAPLGGFTPDADFPLIYAEKGTLTLRIAIHADTDSMNPRVVAFEGGQRTNMVPDHAYAVVECHSETAAAEWEQKVYKYARQHQLDVEVNVSGSRIQIVTHGVSAHGSEPDRGVNAIVKLACVLSGQSVSNASMWRSIAVQDTKGGALGLECSDDITGALTSNLGRAYLDGDQYVFLFNIRYPLNVTKEELLARCQEYVSDKWRVTGEGGLAPLHVPLDSPVVKTLLKVYAEHTGAPADPITIGGATYARAIPNAVAFGALFPGQPDLAHQKDECWALEDYFRCIEIYAHAMFELANTL